MSILFVLVLFWKYEVSRFVIAFYFPERVCDTVYDTDESKKDDFACITVSNPVCKYVDQTIYDKVMLSLLINSCRLYYESLLNS